jgi:bcr-type benzoyl-CoA reductase subunit D
VLLPAVLTFGHCRHCRSGRENICEQMKMLGCHVDGGYAEFVLAPARECFSLPQEIPLEEACLIGDAMSTPYHAVKHRAEVRLGETVAIFGCGGVGINAVQFAAIAGAHVIAVDIDDRKLEFARRFGARDTLNPRQFERVDKELKKRTGGGVDVALEVIGKAETIRAAYDSLRPGGRLCVVGYSAEAVSLAFSRLMFYELSVVGSLGCRPGDYPDLIGLVRAGLITAGVDVGSSSVKIVLLRWDGEREFTRLHCRIERIRRREMGRVNHEGYQAALKECGIAPKDVAYVASTGEGELVDFRTGHFYGMTTHARGALFLMPQARAVLDVGALHARAMVIDDRSRVLAYRMTSQCASGSGQFLENVARCLGIAIEDVGPLSCQASNPQTVSSICALLAETDVIHMVSWGISTADILKGIHLSMAARYVKISAQSLQAS